MQKGQGWELCAVQATPDNIVYALVDSADWIEGVELRLGMQPPKQPFHR